MPLDQKKTVAWKYSFHDDSTPTPVPEPKHRLEPEYPVILRNNQYG